MPELPPFPVDPGTLDAIEGALHGPNHPAFPGCTIDEVLELLSGWTPAGDETVHDGAVHVDTGPLYSREDVILALIQEVRALRRPEPEHDSPTGQCSDNCPACFGVNPGVAADEVRTRADRIIAHGDPEWQHHREDELLYDLVKTYAPPAVYAEVTRLADADFDRWYA